MNKIYRFPLVALVVAVMTAPFSISGFAQQKESPMKHPTIYRTVQIDGLSIFYREAGPKDAPTILLLHGLPFRFQDRALTSRIS
jgi:hypothetical protein